jgi:hypothetical protein
MPFREPFNAYYSEILKPAIETVGLRPLRADEIYGTKAVITDIWNAIWRARVIIADVTGRNPNVNYELGLCHALGMPTILITKDSNDVPFDYRHRRYIQYDTDRVGWDRKLAGDLENTLKVVLADPAPDHELRWPNEPANNVAAAPIAAVPSRLLVMRGITYVYDLIKTAYGPQGLKVGFVEEKTGSTPTQHGLTIASTLRAPNSLEQHGIRLMQSVGKEVSDVVGDFTKTAILLSAALLAEGYRSIETGLQSLRFYRYSTPASFRCNRPH